MPEKQEITEGVVSKDRLRGKRLQEQFTSRMIEMIRDISNIEQISESERDRV